MNFDDLKSSYQSLSFSGGEGENIDFTRKIENVLEQVRKEDIRDKQRFLKLMILFAGLGLAFSFLGILIYVKNPESSGYWGFVLYVLALIAAIPFIVKKYQRIGRISYDVPVAEFIANVEKRYALFQTDQLWVIPFLLIIDVSFVFNMARSAAPTMEIVLRSQFFFIMLLTFALLIAVIGHRKKIFLLEELRRIKESLK
jgi:hypothetical protein